MGGDRPATTTLRSTITARRSVTAAPRPR